MKRRVFFSQAPLFYTQRVFIRARSITFCAGSVIFMALIERSKS